MKISDDYLSMLRLDKTLCAWGTPDFEAILKGELAQNVGKLPLQQGLLVSNYVAEGPITTVVYGVTDLANLIRVKAGIFYQGVIGGCSCADDPTPTSENNECCEVQLYIDKTTAVTTVVLITE